MDRPALAQLMTDLRQGLIDVIVVYKVDRLTRSLADFAKIVETLDSHKASFVSVTQQFNTTTSMGRLTLNVLLSFAQFEREVTGERIRDKIAASKRKGMWMGGNIPLGYDVRNRQLVVNEAEAETVRHIFRTYAELGTVAALQDDLRRRGIVSKVWTSTGGRVRGGVGYSRGALYYLLRNQIYLGRVPHKQESYDGQHAAIVDQDLWDRVQTLLSAKGTRRGRGAAISSRSSLSGLLYDDRGNAMSPTYTKKRDGRRYRYYVSQALLQNDRARAGTVSRVPAKTIEQLLNDEVARRSASVPHERKEGRQPAEDRSFLQEAVDRAVVSKDWVEITLRTNVANSSPTSTESDQMTDEPSKAEVIRIPVRLVHRGRGGCIDTEREPSKPNRPDAALVKAICRAHEWLGRFERGEVASHRELARAEHVTPAYVRSVLQLAFLAPELVEVFLDGRRRPRTGLMALLGEGLALSWQGQNQIV
jgi:site-specific DNA recombinase